MSTRQGEERRAQVEELYEAVGPLGHVACAVVGAHDEAVSTTCSVLAAVVAAAAAAAAATGAAATVAAVAAATLHWLVLTAEQRVPILTDASAKIVKGAVGQSLLRHHLLERRDDSRVRLKVKGAAHVRVLREQIALMIWQVDPSRHATVQARHAWSFHVATIYYVSQAVGVIPSPHQALVIFGDSVAQVDGSIAAAPHLLLLRRVARIPRSDAGIQL